MIDTVVATPLNQIQVIQTIDYFNVTEYNIGGGGGSKANTTSLVECFRRIVLSPLLGVGRSLLTPRISLEVQLANENPAVICLMDMACRQVAAITGSDDDKKPIILTGGFNVNFPSEEANTLIEFLKRALNLTINTDAREGTRYGTIIDAVFPLFS
ncbi:hypothetical protein TNCV_4837381 [Trichonephila clavipes]|nr:hypothetical protein TNCV_4837381 [Trichonephila clavipes]